MDRDTARNTAAALLVAELDGGPQALNQAMNVLLPSGSGEVTYRAVLRELLAIAWVVTKRTNTQPAWRDVARYIAQSTLEQVDPMYGHGEWVEASLDDLDSVD